MDDLSKIIRDEIFKSIHLITDAKLREADFSSYLISAISYVDASDPYHYKIRYQGNDIDVYSIGGQRYKLNDSVIVLYSNADFNKKKIILSSSTNSISSSFNLVGQTLFSDGSTSAPSISNIDNKTTGIYFPSGDNIGLVAAGSEILRINGSGNVGIGITGPAAKLHVNSDLLLSSGASKFTTRFGTLNIISDYQFLGTAATTNILGARFSNNINGFRIHFAKSRATAIGGHAVVQSNDVLGSLCFGGSDGTKIIDSSRISAEVEGTATTDVVQSRLIFATGGGTTTSVTEKMRITSSGNVGIGLDTPTEKLHVSGNILSTGTIDAGTQFLGQAADTVSAPSFSWTGDTNTGIYRSDIDTMGLVTNGVERIRLDSSGRIIFAGVTAFTTRIGTTNTTPRVQTAGTNSGNSSMLLSSFNTNGSINGSPNLYFAKSGSTIAGAHTILNDGNVSGAIIFGASDGTNIIESARIFSAIDGAPGVSSMPGRIVFSTTLSGAASASERMQINNAGNVGINTTAPAARLHINNDILASNATAKFETRVGAVSVTPDYQFFGSAATSGLLVGRFTNNNAPPRLYFAKSRNATSGSHTIVANGDAIGSLSFGGSDGTQIIESARISAEADGAPGAGSVPGRIVFLTTVAGSAIPTERLRIGSTGTLTSLQTYAQAVGVTNRAMYVDSTGVIGNLTSSIRFKQNVEAFDVTPEKVLQLEPKTYYYKKNVEESGSGAVKQIGFIAEDAEALGLKYLYQTDSEGLPNYFAYEKLPIYLLGVIKKQQNEIDSLRLKIDDILNILENNI